MDITRNEMLSVLRIFKSPEKEFNATSISKELNITPMGALKILKRLEKENILAAKVAGKATFYRINFRNDYAKDYLMFVLKREAEHSSPYVKRWITEVRKIKNADIVLIFGSVLKKEGKADDVDVLIVTSQDRFEKLNEEIKDLNQINEKEMHAIFQSSKDLEENILRRDAVVLNALKGIIAFGEEKLIELVK
ncbi:MAG: winged helix-turn-helix domain-containing protein [Nanoarchaeota archaeon]|nr:winged helix-turn-helix domain-containing protein [Nanoarchaeota archaeon]MBU4452231.1 winged helix-turn-helix domain-containing protein [Nanoarchaeota archaeon]MCG2723658.1 winged helix-turn-helix domain-containing protein [archaeon]